MEKILFSKSEKSLLILLIFILSLIVIWLLFIKETSELKSEYEKLKDLYIKQLYFDKKIFLIILKNREYLSYINLFFILFRNFSFEILCVFSLVYFFVYTIYNNLSNDCQLLC